MEQPDQPANGAGLISSLVLNDSMDVVYYNKPFTDPERYTRFFRVARIADSAFAVSLQGLLLSPGVKEDSLRKCMSEGKMIIPMGGDAFRTVYFSRQAKPCDYLYVIRDGSFYYYEMADSLRNLLDVFEKMAKEPLPAAAH